jgi:multidrug efflux pump subunit AcrB
MIKSLIRFSAHHPVSVLSALGALVLLGLISAFLIPLDFLPLMKERTLIVSAEYPGVTAEEMRTMVTIPLEDAFATLGGLKSLSSVSREGLSLLQVDLHWGTDTDLSLAESREIIDICFEGLPSLCSKPKVAREGDSQKDNLTIILIPLDGDLRYGRHIAETDIKPRLQRITGAAMVTVSGGVEEEIQIRFRKPALESRGLSLSTAADIIAAANFEYPGGTIREADREYTVKTAGLYRSLDEIRNTPLSWDQGSLLKVSDIADVVRESSRQDTFFLYRSVSTGITESMECIRIGVQKQRDAAPLPLSFKIRKEIESLNTLYSQRYRFEIAEDLSDQILESLRSLIFSALAAVISASLIVYFFLKSIKLSMVITGIIPLSALAAVLTLGISGRSLNIMSLSGIAIGIGMVIDAGTVAIEQIEGEIRSVTKSGDTWPDPVIRGVHAVALSSGASALSTVIVFFPVFFIPGLLGELFSDMAISVIASILCSCILSFTYIPALITLIRPYSNGKTTDTKGAAVRLTKGLESYYRLILRFFFRKPRYALIPLGICMAIGLVSLRLSNFTLLPELAAQSISWEITFPPGTSLGKMRRVALDLSQGLENIQEIQSLEITAGIGKDDYNRLVQPGEIPEKIRFTGHVRGKAARVRVQIAENFHATPYPVIFTGNGDILSQILGLGEARSIVRGESPGEAQEKAENLALSLTDISVTSDQDFIPHVTRSNPSFTPDRLALARYSLSAQYLAQTIRAVLDGIKEYYYEDGREIPLLIKLRDEDITSTESLGETMVSLESGSIPLRLLGSMKDEYNDAIFYRYNRLDAKIFPFDIPRYIGDQFDLMSPTKDENKEMIRTGLLLLATTLSLLYLSMGAQFGSFLIPLILLLAIPPSFSGALFLLLITSTKPDINSIIALVVLFGISINNSILLYESCLQAAIIENCVKKLRAIFITNITTIASLIPFAFNPFGNNSQSSLSIALIGGLTFSFVLVLILVPLCIGFIRRKK